MKPEHMISVSGKDFVTYEGLLAEAHEQGLCRIATTLIQIPHADNGNVAIVAAEVETKRGTFSGIGDASAANVGRMIAPHIVRMAETRAKARALRDATNIGVTAFEELGDIDAHDEPTRSTNVREFHDLREQPKSGRTNHTQARETGPTSSSDKMVTANQSATIAKLSRLLGRSENIPEMTYAEAQDRITALSREYNGRQGGPAPSQRSAQAQDRVSGIPPSESQLKAIRALSREVGEPEDPQAGEYTKSLASARIDELQAMKRARQGGQQ